MKRRDFFKYSAAIGSVLGRSKGRAQNDLDYVVVGSGAGGGTVAARLVEKGFRVLVLEAGGDPETAAVDRLPEDYQVPAFHALSTENPRMKWDFFVRHYSDPIQQRRDPKYLWEYDNKIVDGVWYPRAGTLGGCTAHNAMIFVYPNDSDWNELADLTGDASWRAQNMRSYFERLENCRHRWFERSLSRFGLNPSRHGWSGWLHTERAEPGAAVKDRDLVRTIIQSSLEALQELGFPNAARLAAKQDPNDWRVVKDREGGLRYTPLTTRNHQRMGTRERLIEIQRDYPGRLQIELNALVTRVLFDGTRAIGVEYQKGERLYRAHPNPSADPGGLLRAYASREVILSGGAFNTPQLLMLSGVGPEDELRLHNIPTIVNLPGVGKNLQDRYEVAVVNRMAFPAWDSLQGATFTKDDQQYKEWADDRSGVYTSNGVILALAHRSSPGQPNPDLFCILTLAHFAGYVPGYSGELSTNPNCLTWVVLKGHTNNTAGEVTLRSSDPRDPPRINFHYFNEGNDASGHDLKAVVDGLKLVRRLTQKLKEQGHIAREEIPGEAITDDSQLEQFVKDHAWGHHASGTCAIGDPKKQGVVSSDFKVHGTTGLRVVDASVFPRIPGLFIVSAVYMIGEKAADVIAAEANGNMQ